MSNQAFARKKRQLKLLAQKLEEEIHANAFSSEAHRLRQKIRRLMDELARFLNRAELQKIISGVTVFLGFAGFNQASAQSFGSPQNNPFGLSAATTYFRSPALADLDGDGDMDLMTGDYYNNLYYYVNTGSASNPQFAVPVSAPFGIDTAALSYISMPTFVDLDNDGDYDMLVGTADYYNGNTMVYYPNTGTANNPQFGSPQVMPFGLGSGSFFAIPTFGDLDNDGDYDLLVGQYTGALAYYENTGTATAPQFATPLVNPFGMSGGFYISSPALVDLDEDGDLDLLVGEYYGNFKYFENTGTAASPQFASPVTNPMGLSQTNGYAFISVADLDGDADMDLLVGEYYGDLIYFENTTDIGLKERADRFTIRFYPNPASDYVKIETRENLERVELLDMAGKTVLTIDDPTPSIPLREVSSGMYLLKITNTDGESISRKLKVQ